MRLIMVTIVALASLSGIACITTPAGVTCSTIPLTSRDTYVVIGKSEGSDWGVGLFNLSFIPYSAYEALQKAKANAGADGLINVPCENKVFWVTIIHTIITYNTLTIRGDAIKYKR
ncbi:MAG: hypothetical protein N2246_11475, partial [Candidatus Sumerlaeia bacterium]|nr:hypothetical protein [Candidatus Sumerlaeia bacterium]